MTNHVYEAGNASYTLFSGMQKTRKVPMLHSMGTINY